MNRRDFLRVSASSAAMVMAGQAAATEDNTKYRPMRPGAQIGSHTPIGGYKKGTLTCFVESFVDPYKLEDIAFLPGSEPKLQKFAVTCSHVFSDGTDKVLNYPATQPSVFANWFFSEIVGIIWVQVNIDKADAALVYLNEEYSSGPGYVGKPLPPYTGGFTNNVLKLERRLTGVAEPLEQGKYSLVGMESGLVDAVADVVPAQFNDGVGHTGFGITTATAITNGDSGGPVIDSNGKLVGIVTAGDPNNMKKVHCCTAANVLDALSTALTDRYNQELPRGKPKADGWRLGLRLCSQ